MYLVKTIPVTTVWGAELWQFYVLKLHNYEFDAKTFFLGFHLVPGVTRRTDSSSPTTPYSVLIL